MKLRQRNLFFHGEQPHAQLSITWKMLQWHRKCMSGWVYTWPLANPQAMGHAKSDSHRLLCRRKAKHNLPFGLHAILFFREMWLHVPWPQRPSQGRTAKWLWSQCPQNTTVPIHYLGTVCTKIYKQVISWKSARNSSRGSLIGGPHTGRADTSIAGGHTWAIAQIS